MDGEREEADAGQHKHGGAKIGGEEEIDSDMDICDSEREVV